MTNSESETFEQAAGRLFATVRDTYQQRRAAWEAAHGPCGEEESAMMFELPVVCVEHERFIPCRSCMYDTPAQQPYSDNQADVEAVRKKQAGTNAGQP